MSEEFWNVRLVGPGIPLRNKRIRIPLCRRRVMQKSASEILSKNIVFTYKAVWKVSPLLDERIYVM